MEQEREAVGKQVDGISSMAKAAILRLLRALLDSEKGKRLAEYGWTPLEAEGLVLELLDRQSVEQMKTVIKAGVALVGSGDRPKTSEGLQKWLKGWLGVNAPGVEWGEQQETLMLVMILGANETVNDPRAIGEFLRNAGAAVQMVGKVGEA